MSYKSPKTARDLAEFHKPEPQISRRSFLNYAAAMGAVGFVGSQFMIGDLAYAAALNCPPTSTLTPGGFGQVYMQGGPAAVPIFPSMMSSAMSSAMAANYGTTGTANFVQAGGNWVTDNQSPWGNVLLAGPPGVSAAAWAAILKNTYIGGSYGDLGQDDGNGANEGLVSAFALINGKGGPNAKDIRFNTTNTPAKYAVGPNASLKNATPATLAATLSMIPVATGLTTSADITASSAAALAIEGAYESVNPVSSRKSGTNLLNSAGCGFNNNPPTASTTYGTTNYVPSGIAALTSLIPAASMATMSSQNQAILAAAYQSATGFNGGVIFTNGSCDYHQTGNQNIANQDQTNANALVAMLAGFAAAKQNGVIQMNANGFAISNGTGAASITINGTATAVQSGTAQNDAGGTFSQNLLLFYSANGAVLSPTMLGSLSSSSGQVQGAAGSPANSMAGNAASVIAFLNKGNITNAFLQASGLSAAQLLPLMTLS